MGRRIRDYVKYTFRELEHYVETPTSCVTKINTPLRLLFPPYGLGNFRQTLRDIIAEKKIGLYDAKLKGIILDMRNIMVVSDMAALRFDDPAIHLNLLADCYVFQPKVGSIIQGLVKHTSESQIGVIIYRVFSVSIRLKGQVPKRLKLNSQIEFRIKQFDLENFMPFIEGELVEEGEARGEKLEQDLGATEITPTRNKKSVSFALKTETGSSGYNSDGSPSKHRKTESTTSDSDDDSAPSPKQVKSTPKSSQKFRGSPDLFADQSEDENNAQPRIKSEKLSQISPVKIKTEKLSQEIDVQESLDRHNTSKSKRESRKASATESELSDLEPGQKIKHELTQSFAVPDIKDEPPLHSQRKKSKHKKHSISLSETSDVDVKPRIKTEKLSKSLIEDQPHEEVEANRHSHHKKSKTKVKLENVKEEEDIISSTPITKRSKADKKTSLQDSFNGTANLSAIENPSHAVNHVENPDTTKRRKRKHADAAVEIPETMTPNEEKGKRRKISTSDAPIVASVILDSDLEMIGHTSGSKHKKKKSKDKSYDKPSGDGKLEDTIEIVDVDDFSPKKEKKKKKKSKEKNVND